jgi:photosystem II stability/assembly factor-like uncharacterized protein
MTRIVVVVGCLGALIAPQLAGATTSGAPTVTNIAFWEVSRGIAGVEVPTADGKRGAIWLTEDGGKTFTPVLETERPVSWVDTAGRRSAVAIIGKGAKRSAVRTRDGGHTWTGIPTGEVFAPSFATRRHGIAVVGEREFYWLDSIRSELRVTRNGGRSWKAVASPCPRHWFVGAALTGRSEAVALCAQEGAAGLQAAGLFSSNDLGRSWTTLAAVGSFSAIYYVTGMSFSPQGLGFLWGAEPDQISTDGGRHWDAVHLIRRHDAVVFASMVTSRAGYVLSDDGLLKTSDGGRSWEVVNALVVTPLAHRR